MEQKCNDWSLDEHVAVLVKVYLLKTFMNDVNGLKCSEPLSFFHFYQCQMIYVS